MGQLSPTSVRWILMQTLGSIIAIGLAIGVIWAEDKIIEAGDLTH